MEASNRNFTPETRELCQQTVFGTNKTKTSIFIAFVLYLLYYILVFLPLCFEFIDKSDKYFLLLDNGRK